MRQWVELGTTFCLNWFDAGQVPASCTPARVCSAAVCVVESHPIEALLRYLIYDEWL
jgi:hypothetical protein